MTLAIIGGSSLFESDVFEGLAPRTVTTPHGLVRLFAGDDLLYCQRHHADPDGRYAPPHRINQHAILTALKFEGATRIVAFCSTGALKAELPPGTIVVPDDYLNPWAPITFHDGDRSGHLIPTFDDTLRKRVLEALQAGDLDARDAGVYVQTIGPRFETKAEVRLLAAYADVVGMTGAHEATLAQELELPYAMVCMVDNYGNGVIETPLTMDEFEAKLVENRALVERAVRHVVEKLKAE